MVGEEEVVLDLGQAEALSVTYPLGSVLAGSTARGLAGSSTPRALIPSSLRPPKSSRRWRRI